MRGGRGGFSTGPPDVVLPMGKFIRPCEGDMVCKSVNAKIAYFNAPIYLENKTQIGKVDEILGPINEVYFTVKLQDGVLAKSFKEGDQVYIGSDKLLPLERFLPKPMAPGGKPGKPLGRQGMMGPKRGGMRGGMRGGGMRGGGMRGGSRGGMRGGRGGMGARGGFRGRGGARGRGGY
ncbi:MAG: hypothetical protein SGCHY_002115 [Lobulomycetales sp.]